MLFFCGALVMIVLVIVHLCHRNVSQKPKTQTAKVIKAGVNAPLRNKNQHYPACVTKHAWRDTVKTSTWIQVLKEAKV